MNRHKIIKRLNKLGFDVDIKGGITIDGDILVIDNKRQQLTVGCIEDVILYRGAGNYDITTLRDNEEWLR